ncbi:MAG: hypothetical protein KJO31_06670 [Gammaproteobacteria bacterium]|nr:hypothetical protein [Gammaproteobacteria bacterium]
MEKQNSCRRPCDTGGVSVNIASMASFSDQLRRHSVALISLFIALSGLAYNTWRNEQTEENNNIRTAGIEMLLLLGEFDRTVFHLQYDQGLQLGNERTGWSLVLTIRDLGTLIGDPANSSSAELLGTWESNNGALGERSATSFNNISAAVDVVREDVLDLMSMLD